MGSVRRALVWQGAFYIPLQPLLHSTVLLWIQCRIIVSLLTMATIITVCVILLFAQSSSSSSSSSSCPCSEPLFHCDEYEQRCLSFPTLMPVPMESVLVFSVVSTLLPPAPLLLTLPTPPPLSPP